LESVVVAWAGDWTHKLACTVQGGITHISPTPLRLGRLCEKRTEAPVCRLFWITCQLGFHISPVPAMTLGMRPRGFAMWTANAFSRVTSLRHSQSHGFLRRVQQLVQPV